MNDNSTVIANRVYFGYFWPIFIDSILISLFILATVLAKDILFLLCVIPFLAHGSIVTTLRVISNKKDRIIITYKDGIYTVIDDCKINLKQNEIYAVVGKNKRKFIFFNQVLYTNEYNYGKLIIYCSYGKIKLKNVYTPDLVAYEMNKYIKND